MKYISAEKNLSRVAGCLGFGLVEREGYEGFILYDLRNPDNIVADATEPEGLFKLADVAKYLHRVLTEMDPEEIGSNRIDQLLHLDPEQPTDAWCNLYGYSLILRAADFWLYVDQADEINGIVYQKMIDILVKIVEDIQSKLMEKS